MRYVLLCLKMQSTGDIAIGAKKDKLTVVASEALSEAITMHGAEELAARRAADSSDPKLMWAPVEIKVIYQARTEVDKKSDIEKERKNG